MTARHYDWLSHHAKATPESLCWVDLHSDRRFSFKQANERCCRLAAHLARECAVTKGDRVAMLAMNSTDMMEVHSACARIGAIFLPLNWRLAAPEIDFILGDAQASVLIHDSSTAQIVGALNVRPEHVIETTGGGASSAYEHAITHSDGDHAPVEVSHDDTWTIMYTSGTTGRPKGALNTYGMAFINAVNLGVPAKINPDSIGLTALPIFHTGGLNCYATPLLHAGGASLIMRAFDPGAVLALINDPAVGLSHFLGVPANYLFMSQHADFERTDFSRLVAAGVGGAPTPLPLLEAYKAKGVALPQAFGMTETGPLVCYQDAKQAQEKVGSAGRCALHAELKIVREDGTDADLDEVGELWVKGPNITPGYWRRPEANKSEFVDGWFKTGDAARIDADGDVWIVDRWKDMYISGGENVYPAEVESTLFALEGVADAAVIGASDERWGEVGVAFIVAAQGVDLSEEAVIGHCHGKIARFKIPARVVFIEELPRNATGKVLRRELRELN
jgi:fatty-acyl-CoA synthase